MDETTSFGAWLRRRRKLLDLTQDELARRVGCTRNSLNSLADQSFDPLKRLTFMLFISCHGTIALFKVSLSPDMGPNESFDKSADVAPSDLLVQTMVDLFVNRDS